MIKFTKGGGSEMYSRLRMHPQSFLRQLPASEAPVKKTPIQIAPPWNGQTRTAAAPQVPLADSGQENIALRTLLFSCAWVLKQEGGCLRQESSHTLPTIIMCLEHAQRQHARRVWRVGSTEEAHILCAVLQSRKSPKGPRDAATLRRAFTVRYTLLRPV
jgi:hypothetical protein